MSNFMHESYISWSSTWVAIYMSHVISYFPIRQYPFVLIERNEDKLLQNELTLRHMKIMHIYVWILPPILLIKVMY